MTVLGLILGIEVAGLAFALFVARAMTRHESGTPALRRLGGALERAGSAFLLRQSRQVALMGLIVVAALLAVYGVLATPGASLGRVEFSFWLAANVLAGAVCAALAAFVAARLVARGGMRVVSSARLSVDRALGSAIRLGGAAGIVAEALSLLGPIVLFAVPFSIKGGFTLQGEPARLLAGEIALLLPAFALGGVTAALVIQRGAALYHAAGDVGGDVAGERDAGLEHDDPRNPALISDLVGDQLGVAAARTVDGFASASAISVATVLLVLRAPAEVLPLALLPLLVRSFGLVACATGMMVVRSDEAQSPELAILRGHASALLVLVVGLAAAAHTVLGTGWWLLGCAGALGPIGAALAAYGAQYRLLRRRSAMKQTLDSLRIGDGAVVATGIGVGLQAALVPVVVLGATAIGAWWLGGRSGIAAGPELALLTWLSALAALAPYAAAVSTFGALADSARGIAGVGALDDDAQRRTARLDDSGFAASAMAQSYFIQLSTVSALGAALALSALGLKAQPAGSLSPATPTLVWCGALGAAFVLAYAGGVARAAVRAAREVALEVERQLRGFPREHGKALIPAEYTPSYRSCEELTSKHALAGALPEVGVFLVVPLLLGVGLRLMYRSGNPWLLAEGLTSFVVVAAITGLGAALVAFGARAALGSARRATRSRGSSPEFAASVSGDVVADILGNVAGPAAHLMGKAGAALLLALAPFLL
ncbi:MAG TPA: sodium/proton-translocating pyrophosphatase [Polyangiaceae bacterium]|nr:sodium/proton-translocating pyrophosphatase [Polyangiaceae bacterium]